MMKSPTRPASPTPFWRPFHDSAARPVQPVPDGRSLVQRMTSDFGPGMTPGLSQIPQGAIQGVSPRGIPRVKPRGDPENSKPREIPRVATVVE